MSAFWVGKLIHQLQRNRQLAEEFQTDPDAVMNRFPLTDEEKAAIRNKDLRYIYELGVNPYLIAISMRHLRLKQEELPARLAGAGPHPELKTVSFPQPPQNGEYLIKKEVPSKV